MATEAQRIVEQALRMPIRDRAEIVQRLLDSLDQQVDTDIDTAWQSEIERRIAEIDSGRVSCISWEEVRERLTRNPRDPG